MAHSDFREKATAALSPHLLFYSFGGTLARRMFEQIAEAAAAPTRPAGRSSQPPSGLQKRSMLRFGPKLLLHHQVSGLAGRRSLITQEQRFASRCQGTYQW
jgi:hypothetical protein